MPLFQTDNYSVPISHHANGNTTSNNLAYDQRNRLAGWKLQGGQIALGGDSAQYGYNGKGERTLKQVTYNDHCLAPACYPGPGAPTGWLTGTAAFAYDEAGRLIGEYPSLYGPGRNTEYIYLDSTPIAAIRSGQLHQIETDHLGTPRAIVKPGTTPSADVTVWRWDLLGNTFGADAPNEDADGDGTAFTFNLRYPGQYFDAETGLSYNYFRDYEPGTGRYIESDPIGLTGGVNTYAYAFSSTIREADVFGLAPNLPPPFTYAGPPPWSRLDRFFSNRIISFCTKGMLRLSQNGTRLVVNPIGVGLFFLFHSKELGCGELYCYEGYLLPQPTEPPRPPFWSPPDYFDQTFRSGY